MKSFVLITILMLCCVLAFAQAKQQKKKTYYKTWVKLYNDNKPGGLLYQVTDTSILITDSFEFDELHFEATQNLNHLIYYDIRFIELKRKKSAGQAALIGALSGLVIGGILGFADGDDDGGIISFTAGEKALIGGGMGAITGAGLGVMLSSFKFRIPINGKKRQLDRNRKRLERFSIQNP
jgi:hypothetical protein